MTDAAPAIQPQPSAAAAGSTPSARDVRERHGTVEWRCATCDGWNPLEAAACSVCGTSRRGFGEVTERPTPIGETGVIGASMLLPGLGHVLAGRAGTGLARAILAVLWVLGGLVLVVNSDGLAALPGWLLLASAAVLWATTLLDARSLAAGDGRQLLTTRRLAALVLTVTLGLVGATGLVVLSGAG